MRVCDGGFVRVCDGCEGLIVMAVRVCDGCEGLCRI